MKKIVLMLMVLLSLQCGAFAYDCLDYDCVAPYNMNNKFRTVVGAISGVNSLTELKLESIIKKEVLKLSSAEKVKVDFDSYSARDLKNGIFKSMKISAKNILINDIHLSSLDLATLCDFNYIKQVDKDIIFVEDFPMSFDLTMSQDDINRTMQHPRYKKLIEDLNLVVGSFAKGVKISSTKVAIKNRRFYYIVGFSIPFIRSEQKLVLQSDVAIKNGNIDLTNSRVVSGNFNLDLKRADFLLSRLNPIDFSVNILKNKNAKVKVNNLQLSGVGNSISASGIIIVPKESYE